MAAEYSKAQARRALLIVQRWRRAADTRHSVAERRLRNIIEGRAEDFGRADKPGMIARDALFAAESQLERVEPALSPEPALPPEHEGMWTFDGVRSSADAVVLTDDGCVLLVKRKFPPFKGYWALPGGNVEAGETPAAAAARELTEETGIVFDQADLQTIDIFDAPDRDPRGRMISTAFLARLESVCVPTAGDDAADAKWFYAQLERNDDPPAIAFDHDEILRQALTLAAWERRTARRRLWSRR